MGRLTKAQQTERAEAIDTLREILAPGDKVYGIVRHVARSGMSRHIDFYKVEADGPRYLSGYMARALDERRSDAGALVVGGCGMDMIFATVYNLSRTLWPDGFDCIGESSDGSHWTKGCPANDHYNDRGQRDYSPTRHHQDGGYALRSDSL